MRMTGSITKFVQERGFGFIRPDAGGKDVFVHVSALAGSRELRRGDRVTFEISPNAGKGPKAINVERVAV